MSIFATQPIGVLLVDDHRSVLWGLTKLIESARPQLDLLDVATCHGEALAAMQKHRPHVVLLDLDLGSESGFDLVPQLASQAAVLILTGLRDSAAQERAVLAGARGVIHKTEPAEVILKAIGCVHAGEPWLDRIAMGRVLQRLFAAAKRTAASRYPDGCRAQSCRCRCASTKRTQQGHRRNTTHQRTHAAQPPEHDLRKAWRESAGRFGPLCHGAPACAAFRWHALAADFGRTPGNTPTFGPFHHSGRRAWGRLQIACLAGTSEGTEPYSPLINGVRFNSILIRHDAHLVAHLSQAEASLSGWSA